jgi:phage FluMu protein gp41
MEHSFELEDGLQLVEKTHTTCVVRPLTAGDILDAQQDAERLMATPNGYQLVVSDSAMGFHLARRQIVRLGDIPGPLSVDDMRKLSGRDMERINKQLDGLDQAVAGALADRGRDAGAGATD